MNYIYFLSLALILILSGCKKNATEPGGESPLGYQYEIPWPSLADSPWPMNHHDPQSTGRSNYSGPSLGIVDAIIDSFYLYAGVAIGPDSTIYFAALNRSYGLYALKSNGGFKWKLTDSLKIGIGHSTPLIANDGTIYITGGSYGNLTAINPDGKIKWLFKADKWVYHLGIGIDKTGVMYFVSAIGTLYAIDKNGNQLWTISNSDFLHYDITTYTFSPDGKTLYIPGNKTTLYALDIGTKTIKWSFGSGVSYASPIVDSDGNVYLLTSSPDFYSGKPCLFSLSSDGKVKWVYNHNNNRANDHFGYSDATIDKDGNIYFAFDTLYAVDYKGNIKWKKSLDVKCISPLICDNEGNIFISVTDNTDFAFSIWSFDKNGNKRWQTEKFNNEFSGSSPAISADHKLYIPSYKSTKIIIIK
jgi:hypothetical protein